MIKYDEFFPFHRRPFSGLWLPAPNSPKEALATYYKELDHLEKDGFKYDRQNNSSTCSQSTWDHVRKESRRYLSVDCKAVLPFYPFVYRTPIYFYGVKETLQIGDKCYYSFVVSETYNSAWQERPYEVIW